MSKPKEEKRVVFCQYCCCGRRWEIPKGDPNPSKCSGCGKSDYIKKFSGKGKIAFRGGL